MIPSYFYHIQLNIDFSNLGFYKKFMDFMGWSVIFEMDTVLGFKSITTGDIWFVRTVVNETTNYDAKGTNHISFRVTNQSDIDKAVEYLQSIGVKMLFDTPKHRPEFVGNESETYYQIMFETPDKLLFEVVYTGPKD